MYGILRRANVADVARLRARPELVSSFLFGEPPAEPARGGVLRLLRRLVPGGASPSAAPRSDAVRPPVEGEVVELDKAWHGLHFLLTGTADGGDEPACFLLSGGEELGDDDELLPRLLRPEEVRAFAELLDAIDVATLRERYDPERMTALGIYPDPIWAREDERDANLGWLLDAFDELRTFMAAASTAGESVVVCIA